jgi:hypothetical protein
MYRAPTGLQIQSEAPMVASMALARNGGARWNTAWRTQ